MICRRPLAACRELTVPLPAFLAAVLLLLTPPYGVAEDNGVLRIARQALAEDIPQIAIYRLGNVLDSPDLTPAEQTQARELLAEAFLDTAQPAKTLETLAPVTDASVSTNLLRANAHAALGHWSDAFALFHAIQESGPSFAAALGEAEALQALGRTTDAVKVLQKLIVSHPSATVPRLRLVSLLLELKRDADARKILQDTKTTTASDSAWARYLDSRLCLLEKNPAAAIAILDPLVNPSEGRHPEGLSEDLLAAATLALSEAHLTPDNPDPAEKVLEAFIRDNPESPHLESVFQRLDELYAIDRNPTEAALHNFQTLPPRAAALALFYVARLQLRDKRHVKDEKVAKSIESFFEKFPNHPLIPYVYAMKAELLLRTSTPATRQAALAEAENELNAAALATKTPELRAEIALRTALINLQQSQFVRAATHLDTAKDSSRLRRSATFDAALAWLMQRHHERFARELAAFTAEFDAPLLTGELRLEQGLVKARANEPDATRTLRAFLTDFPTHPRRPEAELAVAELNLIAVLNDKKISPESKSEKLDEADSFINTAAANASATPETVEQADYMRIFMEDARRPKNTDKVVALARDFISRHPGSQRMSDVRMKLGQVYFDAEDFLKAQEQFETLAHEQPDGEYTETALFLAGKCAMKLISADNLDRALSLFGRVVERKGSLEAPARLQQALIQNKLEFYDDAAKLCDAVLTSQTPPEPDVRYAALIGKGDNLVALVQKEPQVPNPQATQSLREKSLTDAIAAYDSLLAIPAAGPAWRNQAAYKKGKALQQLGRTQDALAVFYGILDDNTSGPRESFWFAKAGFEAAGILETDKKWANAVGIYEKMAKIPGPHADTARQRIRSLRLEHYLWP